jgi:hypothetical protein
MNENRIKSLVEILKTTIKELEQEMNPAVVVLGGYPTPPRDAIDRLDLNRSDHITFPSANSVDRSFAEPRYEVDYSDVVRYYASDYDSNGAGDAWD